MDDNTPKESPILFNTEMVRAILEGRKTQTRRIMKYQPLRFTGRKYIMPDDVPTRWQDADDILDLSPKGIAGDYLWVKENYRMRSGADTMRASQLAPWIVGSEPIWFEAGIQTMEYQNQPPGKLRPSIFMPRWASRIDLEITNVRVERLQDISVEDAVAEGVETDEWLAWRDEVANYAPGGSQIEDQRGAFMKLWDSINGKGPHNWDANPWVWVYEFRMLD